MSLFGIIVIVAIILAIPTYGLSIIALFFIKRAMDANSAAQIATAAENSKNSNSTVFLPYVSGAAIRKFYSEYGISEKKFRIYEEPGEFYIGYVKTVGPEEHVILLARSGAKTAVSSFMPPYSFSGQDILTMMSRKAFLDKIASSMQAS